MNAYRTLLPKALRVLVPGILMLLCSPGALRAQFLNVDCSGTNPYAYPSINAALPSAGPGAFILVTGTCNESVSLYGQNALNLGAYFGGSAQINGNVSVNHSENIYLYGLSVTNSFGDGINVNNSRGVTLDTCTSNGNAGVGLSVGGMSDVSVNTAGSFDYNAKGGMNIGGNSIVQVGAWAGLVDISNNGGPGIFASQANFRRWDPPQSQIIWPVQDRFPDSVSICAAELMRNLPRRSAPITSRGTNQVGPGYRRTPKFHFGVAVIRS